MARFREQGIVLPTFAQLADPSGIDPALTAGVDKNAPDPRNLWRVQYFNSMQTLILNTLEVVEVPEVAMAAADDLADSRERLRELLDWMGESGSA